MHLEIREAEYVPKLCIPTDEVLFTVINLALVFFLLGLLLGLKK